MYVYLEEENMSPKGGKRIGAGRPKGGGKWGNEETKAVRLPKNRIKEVLVYLQESDKLDEKERSQYALPLYGFSVPAGFPTMTEDHVERKLNLNEYLIAKPMSTFFVRVSGDSMKGAGIISGDILSIDRSRTPVVGDIVVAAIDGELTVKRLSSKNGELFLMPENESYREIKIKDYNDSVIWGVVTSVVRKL